MYIIFKILYMNFKKNNYLQLQRLSVKVDCDGFWLF